MITNFWRCWEQVAFNYHFLWGDRFLSFPRLLVLLHIYALYLLRQIIIIFTILFRENILPDIQFQTSAVGCIITVVLISFLAFLSGCFYTFKKIRNRKSSKIRHVLSIVKEYCYWLVLVLSGCFLCNKFSKIAQF